MRGAIPVISASLLWTLALLAQSAGISPETTRVLTEVSEMGRPTMKPETLARSLTFEEDDDPTVAAHSVTPHEPLRAASKAAEKAAHLARKKEHPQAIAKYREAVAIDPLYFQAWNNLALELHAGGQTDEAEQVLRQLMQLNPEHVLVFTNLATLLGDQNRYTEAEAVARAAMKLHRFSFKANFVLGTVLVDEGKLSAEARINLQYAQVKYPEAKALLAHWPDKAAHN